ncbi:ATP-dependent helicase [uncultured Eubacterium sp.]|uniref:ATP-dependent helicase n=1 Tax=uncultured Eubacterium sp. TaxID=165185 RepID=UPI0025FB7B6A|nr:ATP-dependent helicase [uncultured Eubacterium sp.]
MKIDTSQINAIRHKDGPELVLAGPGSGKTLVITRRVQHLIEQYHIPPSTILVITFTKAAATEMRQRFEKLMGGRRVSVSFGTFHAVYFMILKHAYGYTADNIVKEEQRLQFMKEYIHRLRLEYDDENEFIFSLLSEISLVKNTSVNLAHYYSSCCGQDVFRKIFEAYESFLHQNRLIDFDDMLVYCKELLVQRPDILAAWQRKYQYILIDEFQDINQIQYDIIRMLAAPQDNLFIVGDDDQSIYRFRGAKPEIMLNFTKDYPNAGKIILDINYRSGAEIVKQAGNLISYNEKRFDKRITPATENGISVVKQEFHTQREQNLYVIQEILRLHKEGMEYNDMAVLFRTNMQPRFLMEMMLDYSIPFTAKDRIPNIYDHWITRDLFAYIDIARGDRSRSSFLKIMNRPKRYLSRESLPYEEVAFDVWEEFYEDQGWMVQRLEKLQMDLKVIAGMRPFSAINYIRKGVAYEDYLREYADVRRIPFEDLTDVLDELQENARGFETFEAWFEHIEQLRKELEEQAKNYKVTDGVNLSTLHSSKGLEYDSVFLVDVNEKIMPNKKAVLDADLEEERRMFYVGMTRAKNRLYLLWSHQIRNKDMDPSRFLIECEAARVKC